MDVKFEDLILNKSIKMMRGGKFLSYNPEKLALSLIKECRIEMNLQPWNHNLELISGY